MTNIKLIKSGSGFWFWFGTAHNALVGYHGTVVIIIVQSHFQR